MTTICDRARKFSAFLRKISLAVSGNVNFEVNTYFFMRDKIYIRFSRYSTIELSKNITNERKCAIITQKGSEILDKRFLSFDELGLILKSFDEIELKSKASFKLKEFTFAFSRIDDSDYVSIKFNEGISSSYDITNISTLKKTCAWIKSEIPGFPTN